MNRARTDNVRSYEASTGYLQPRVAATLGFQFTYGIREL